MAARVATTQWSQVLAARDGSDTRARRALEALCQSYWQPLYSYVRSSGEGPEHALDLTQGFFAELLDKKFLSSVDRDKGRFRSFLLASLRHHLSHQRDRARALKRGGGARTLSLDVETGELGHVVEPADGSTPIDVFERRWASTVLERAVSSLAMESREEGAERFEHLRQYLTSGRQQTPYRETAATLGMTESGIRSAVLRLRRRLGQLLREEIAATVADPADIDDEVRHLLKVLRP